MIHFSKKALFFIKKGGKYYMVCLKKKMMIYNAQDNLSL